MCSNLPDGCTMSAIDRQFNTENKRLVADANRAEKLAKLLKEALYEAQRVYGPGNGSDTVMHLPDMISEAETEMKRLDQDIYDLSDEWDAAQAHHLEAAE